MSEHIVHIAVMEDSFNLINISKEIDWGIRKILLDNLEIARLASTAMRGDMYVPGLLQDYKKQWNDRPDDGKLEQKLAWVFGWMSHRAADRIMKPTFRETDGKNPHRPTESSTYQEAFIYSKFYQNREADPFRLPLSFARLKKEFPQTEAIDLEKTYELTKALFKRTLIQMHTFIPAENDKDIDSWIDNILELQQNFPFDVKRILSAVINPDPDKTQKYIIEPNLFDDSEPFVALLLAMRGDGHFSADKHPDILEKRPQCLYGQAVYDAHQFHLAALEYFTGKSDDPDILKKALLIGQPGRDGKGV